MDKHEIVQLFALEGTIAGVQEYGSGHINRTELVEMEKDGQREKYILQRINTEIFHDVDGLMENIVGVTDYLRKKIKAAGGDFEREALQVIPTKDGASYCRAEGDCYRMYRFISNAVSYDAVRSPGDFYESALAFGTFQSLLSDYPAETLHETIPDFHNTPKRFADFCEAVNKDVMGRVALARKEIDFLMEREQELSVLTDLQKAGELPLRVTHNDTKLNNVMLDAKTGKGVCVIDLDTVMPSYIFSDVGDFLRTAANTVAEDDPALEKVEFRMDIFKAFMAGYLDSAGVFLTSKELELLPEGAAMFPYMQAVRFLADYINGDTYYKTSYPEHNLVRTRNQMRLLECIEAVIPQMREYIKGIIPS